MWVVMMMILRIITTYFLINIPPGVLFLEIKPDIIKPDINLTNPQIHITLQGPVYSA